jgi:signal peptidase I
MSNTQTEKNKNNSQNLNFFQKIFYYIFKFTRFLGTWIGALIFVMTMIFFIAQAFVIPSGSMIKTLLIGDHLFVKKYVYGIPTPHIPWIEIPLVPGVGLKLFDGDKPKRGDIVTFRKPGAEHLHFVKRCVAVGGDRLFLKNKELYLRPHQGDKYMRENYPEKNLVEVNGVLWVKNPYRDKFKGIHNNPDITPEYKAYPRAIFNFRETVVEKDHYFMMGDNRDSSSDSRFWRSVPYENIEGTPWFVFLSLDENYSIRWDRMFKTIDTLEEDLRNEHK